MLRKDAALEPVGSLSWFSGRDTCLRYVTQFLGAPGDWRMAATTANGQPAAAAYLRGPDGIHRALGLAVLTATAAGIARIVVFGDPGLVTRFGFPPVRMMSRSGSPTVNPAAGTRGRCWTSAHGRTRSRRYRLARA